MHSGLFDVFHHPRHNYVGTITDAVDVNLNGVLEKPINQDRLSLGDGKGLRHEPFKLSLVVADLHRPTAEHKAGPHQRGIADPGHLTAGLLEGPGDPTGGLFELKTVQQFAEFLPVLGLFDRVDIGADDREAGGGKRPGQIERGLAAELDDHAIRINSVSDIEDVLSREGLEEEQVAGVVIGTDRFRVGVDHHAFDTKFAEREAGMATAIVKLDPLPDSIGPTPENHHPLSARRLHRGLVLLLPGRVIVGGLSLKLGGAGIDRLESGKDATGLTTFPHFQLSGTEHSGQLTVRKAGLLGPPEQPVVTASQRAGRPDRLLDLDNLYELVEKPGVDRSQFMQFLAADAGENGIPEIPDSVRVGTRHPSLDVIQRRLSRGVPEIFAVAAESKRANLQPSKRLLESLFESPADRHRLTNALHLRR